MRNLFLSAFFVLALIANIFAVDKNKVTRKETAAAFARNNFNTKYQGAKKIVWSDMGANFKVSFIFNDEKKAAFFDERGRYIATSQYVKPESLPLESLKSLKKSYSGYNLVSVMRLEADEVVVGGQTFSFASHSAYYVVSLKKGSDNVVVKISPKNEISQFKSM